MSARDRQALSSIEDELGESDPRLAALLDEFSRRAAGAAMPAIERIGRRWRRFTGPPRNRLTGPRPFTGLRWRRFTGARRTRRVKWLPAVLVLWLALVCAVVVVLLAAFGGGISKGCSDLVPTHCAPRSVVQR